MKTSKKRLIITISIIAVCLIAVGISVYFIFFAKKSDINDQWGLYNDESVIDEVEGKKDCDINIEKAWKKTKGDKDVIIAVIDSGMYDKNSYLRDSLYVNEKETKNGKDDDGNGYIDDINGWNFYDDNNKLYSGYYNDAHGNCLSTIIVGQSSEDKEEYYGVAPDCTILPLKVLDGSEGYTGDIVSAIDYAHEAGAKIVNCSWVFDETDDDLLAVMKKYDDMLFVCAAGDKNVNINMANSEVYPICYNLENIISVAAVTNSGEIFKASGYGVAIDVAAPGEHVKCVNPEDDFTYLDGTSVAAAFVSGIAGLTLSENKELTTKELKEILCSSYNEIDSLKDKVSTNGIIDAYQCVKKAAKSAK